MTKYSILEVMVLAAESLKTINEDYLLEISNMNYTMNFLRALQLSESVYLELLKQYKKKEHNGNFRGR